MRLATLVLSTLVGLATATASGCLDSTWSNFADTLGVESRSLCYKAHVPGTAGVTGVTFAQARTACTAAGKAASPRFVSRLLTSADSSKTSDGTSLLAAALSSCDPHQQVAGYCPVFWVGARRLLKNKADPKKSSYTWIDGTANDNLDGYLNGECNNAAEFACGPWGYWDNPSDNSNQWVPDYGNTGVDGKADEIRFPNNCAHDTTGSALSRCGAVAAGAEFFGLIDRPTSVALGYICVHETDEDRDGVPDSRDFCPNTPAMAAVGTSAYLTCSGASRNPKCVDAAGCNKLEMDVDGDKFCTSPSPVVLIDGITRPFNGRCSSVDGVDSVDVCSSVYNKLQDEAACNLNTETTECDESCAYGCEKVSVRVPATSARACTNPVNGLGVPIAEARCNEGFAPFKPAGKYTKGCFEVATV